MPLRLRLEGTTSLLGLVSAPHDFASLVEIEPRLDQAYGAYGGELAQLHFEETDAGVRVIDATEGTELSEIEDVGIEFIERWAAGEQDDFLTEHRGGVIADGRVPSVWQAVH